MQVHILPKHLHFTKPIHTHTHTTVREIFCKNVTDEILSCNKTKLDDIKMASEVERYCKDRTDETDLTTPSVSKLYSVVLNEWNTSTITVGRIMKGEAQSRPTRREIVLVPLCTPQIPQTPHNWREIFVVDSVALGIRFSQTILVFPCNRFSTKSSVLRVGGLLGILLAEFWLGNQCKHHLPRT